MPNLSKVHITLNFSKKPCTCNKNRNANKEIGSLFGNQNLKCNLFDVPGSWPSCADWRMSDRLHMI
ncbi:hypothetical protein PROFUN_05850 [Planoprotostelium fungivorum]|uniref:Uncharacterized protein n=1 Tax=Planoprotostelium fungivorum TaxID=1890364 RepID=A0A2P6NKL9_9EUKA|nr:hypothetical protein PROFUN_05850 [Planoprotostelium fungivorum]